MITQTLLYTALVIIGATALLNLWYLGINLVEYRKQRIQIGLLFILLFTTRTLIAIGQGIRLYISPETELLSDTVALGGIIVGFLMVIIAESYWSTHFDNVRISAASAFATMTIIFIFLTRNEVIAQAIQSQFSLFVQLTVPLFFFYVAITLFRLLGRMENYATDIQKGPIKLLRYIIAADYLGAPLFIMVGLMMFTSPSDPLPELNSFTFLWFTIIPSIIYLTIDALWYFALVRYRSFSLLQIQRIEKIILMNPSGMALYQYSPSDESHMDESLISGAIFAIQTVLREGTKIAGKLRSIQMGDYYLLFDRAEGVTTIVITAQPTKYLEALAKLISESVASVVEPDSFEFDVDRIESVVRGVVEVSPQEQLSGE